jgi:hypothetical protein
MLQVLGRLLYRHIEQSTFDVAVDTATQMLALDPLHQPAHRARQQQGL